jgi:hypothetical protein
VTGRKTRDAIRREHRPVGPGRQCAVRNEQYPCDAIALLEDLEAVEAVARAQVEQMADLKRRIADLEAKIRRVVEELSS